MRREADKAHPTSRETAGHREAAALVAAHQGEPMRDLLVAGGLRGFSPEELFA